MEQEMEMAISEIPTELAIRGAADLKMLAQCACRSAPRPPADPMATMIARAEESLFAHRAESLLADPVSSRSGCAMRRVFVSGAQSHLPG